MYKNKFLIKLNLNLNKTKQLSNFEYFKLYIYNLKYSKFDNCLVLFKFKLSFIKNLFLYIFVNRLKNLLII